MPNNCLSALYKHIIQVENKNVGLKVGGAQTYHCPPNQKSGGAHAPLAPPPRFLRQWMDSLCSVRNQPRCRSGYVIC